MKSARLILLMPLAFVTWILSFDAATAPFRPSVAAVAKDKFPWHSLHSIYFGRQIP